MAKSFMMILLKKSVLNLTVCVLTALVLSSGHLMAETRIDVREGEAFEITLKANPSTGYNWNPVFDSQYLQMNTRKMEPGPSGRPGAPGLERFTFVSLKPGKAWLEFRYSRSWERDPVKIERYSINIKRRK